MFELILICVFAICISFGDCTGSKERIEKYKACMQYAKDPTQCDKLNEKRK